MGKFFSRVKKESLDPSVTTWGNLANFYSLLIFLTTIPFVLIIALVWITGILGFSVWIFAGFAALCTFAVWRLYRHWGRIKTKMSSQSQDFQDLMREAARNGKDVEISLMNGVFTLRYSGPGQLATALPARPEPLALEAPAALKAEISETQVWLPPERLREELEEFLKLRDSGVISEDEFERIKANLMQRMSA